MKGWSNLIKNHAQPVRAFFYYPDPSLPCYLLVAVFPLGNRWLGLYSWFLFWNGRFWYGGLQILPVSNQKGKEKREENPNFF